MKKYIVLIAAAIAYGAVFFLKPESFFLAVQYFSSFLLEMVQVLPFVLILSALITEWVPASVIKNSLGTGSGMKGKFFSIVLGSISAGPIYAAFPVCLTLYKKGTSISNLVTIISAWAVIKVPMLFMELKFLGPQFTFARYLFTLPSILIIAKIVDVLIKAEDISIPIDDSILAKLPGKNCKACGYSSCKELATAASLDETVLKKCIFWYS